MVLWDMAIVPQVLYAIYLANWELFEIFYSSILVCFFLLSDVHMVLFLTFADVFILQVKLVWYYNNALGRPNKKKFIARTKA
jgi:hypothetical protein